MEIRQLRYFIAVADTLNYSSAAESVFLSQSALSRQIMALEKELGLQLFERSTRKVELTEAGLILKKSAKDFISRWEKLSPELHNQAAPQNQAMSLTVGTDPRALANTVQRVAVMESFYELRRKYPGIRILFQNLGYQELIRGLVEESLDCAFVLDRELDHHAEIESADLGQGEMVLVFRSKNRHTDEDYANIILNRGLILVDREPQGLYHIIKILNELHLEPQLRFCESINDLTMTVETGESAAILPDSVVAKLDNPHLQIIHLPSEHARLRFSLLWNKNGSNNLIPELKECFTSLFKINESK